MKTRILFAVVVTLASCGRVTTSESEEAWDRWNDPLRYLPRSYWRVFEKLPLAATLDQVPWSDSYWPTDEGGIAHRWNGSGGEGGRAQIMERGEAEALTADQVKDLSPAEKYDLLQGDYDFTLTRAELARTKPHAESWEGLCHGWAVASMVFAEPGPLEISNAEGLKISFGSSDIKALLTYMAAESEGDERVLAQRCDSNFSEHPNAKKRPECQDINAGSFHLALVNELGVSARGMVFDRSRGHQVWNHPIFGYSVEVVRDDFPPREGAAPGTAREVKVRTTVDYASESSAAWEKLEPVVTSEVYDYRLELDARGRVIGGDWLEETRPDFVWKKDVGQFEGYYEVLGTLYEQSVGD
jgi:hypothetical protein